MVVVVGAVVVAALPFPVKPRAASTAEVLTDLCPAPSFKSLGVWPRAGWSSRSKLKAGLCQVCPEAAKSSVLNSRLALLL